MLSAKEKGIKVVCVKCKEEMKKSILNTYEYVEGFPLFDVTAFQCKNCGKLFFTEDMVNKMEERTEQLKINSFGFKRTLAVSGKGLVVRVPSDLIEYLDLKEGENVRIVPVDHKGFLVEKEKK